ncbi:MAG: hypothetical protein JO154_17710 [Chitinophaga sp.]|uniref:hypothetical protein n=1 Tax=Chitinophaga sp. TaxID=1869181 RepID=UPI0025C17178|nr:hypothetical protein [Chitinophaga sp.]MBV8254441.1 hypothetical protein [Chitinophaga sp.]
MKKTILFAVLLFVANYCGAQRFPYGTYYFMPDGVKYDNTWYVGGTQITPRNVSETGFKEDLITLNGKRTVNKVDTVIYENQRYFFVMEERKGTKKLYYAPALIVNQTENDTSIFIIKATGNYATRDEAVRQTKKVLKSSTQTRIYTKTQMQRMAQLPSVNKIDSISLITVLEKIWKEQQVLEARNVRPRYVPGYLHHFVDAGFSPFIGGWDLFELGNNIKNRQHLDSLFAHILFY